MGLKSFILLPSADPLFTQWLFAAAIFVPKTGIRSGLLAIYCRASKSVRAVGDEVLEPEPDPELDPESELEEWLLPSAYPLVMKCLVAAAVSDPKAAARSVLIFR